MVEANGSNAFQILASHLGKRHESEQEYQGLLFVRSEFIDHSRWALTHVDVYWHPATDTHAGVMYRVAATEMQDEDGSAELVPVEKDPTPHFRIKRTPR